MLTLTELLEQRQLTLEEALAWATAIAGELSALHEQGICHGQVTAASVEIFKDGARLIDRPGGYGSGSPSGDIVQFAALLRLMLNGVRSVAAGDRVQWNALDRIATTNARATQGSRMKKVASALRLLNVAHKMEASSTHHDLSALRFSQSGEWPEESPLPPAGPATMPVPEVPQEPERNVRRVHASFFHILGFIGLAAVIAAAGCAIVLKLIH